MISVMIACDRIKAGSSTIVLAGGTESMSQAPYLLTKARAGNRLGHGEMKDHIFVDGIEDAFQPGTLMGCFADACARDFSISRQEQDAFSALSMNRALDAQRNGSFANEITPVTIKDRAKGDVVISVDECPDPVKPPKLPRLKPAFSETGTVTAGNSSGIADGAASLILTSGAECSRRSLSPLAKVIAYCSFGQEPNLFTSSPIGAIRKVVSKAGWTLDEVDLFEINEAFAVVTLCTQKELGLLSEKVNVNGGACALGHPIGASGARIIVTLIYALRQRRQRKGVAVACIGGGEATAIAIEIVESV
jgi:acetyl-CoA C-acetyltransferase